MSDLRKPKLTVAEYLEIERTAEFKSEFFDGVMYAMAGASPPRKSQCVTCAISSLARRANQSQFVSPTRQRGSCVFNTLHQEVAWVGNHAGEC